MAEVCDGIDNDCNGSVDDGLGTVTCGIGACAASVAACTNGVAGVCNPGTPTGESCDGIDNDCNGAIDDGNPGGGVSCSTGQQGVCAAGTTACNGAGTLLCNRNQNPSTDVCDGLDNDCNGNTDNGVANDGFPSSCTGIVAANISPGGLQDMSGTVPNSGGSDFFVVNFTSAPGSGGYYHPMLNLINDGGGQYRILVHNPGCGSYASGCGGNLTTWDQKYPGNPNSCLTFGTCTDWVGKVTSVVVQVVRVAGGSCGNYTVRASNQ